jgi:DNA-binding HxlR family transcriptional regulator
MDRETELLNTSCPVTLAQKIVSGKWKILIVWRLKDGAMRFGNLQRSLPDIKQSSLTQQLRELEQDNIIHREIYKQIPPKVEYSLSEIGYELLKVIYNLGEWGAKYKIQLENSNSND